MATKRQMTRTQRDEETSLALLRAAGDVVCPRCRDTGYLTDHDIRGWFGPLAWQLAGIPVDEIKWCDCAMGQAWRMQYIAGLEDVTQRRLSERFERAGIPDRFLTLGFDTIPEERRAGKELAVAAGRMFAERGHVVPAEVRAYDLSQNHVDRRQKPGLCFVGKPGVGKTGILSVAFRARLGRCAGLWIELYEFFNAVQSQYGREGGDADARVEAAKTAPLLFLDDVGDPDRRDGAGAVRAETDDRRRLLWEILDFRHGRELPTLMTSNLSRSDFEVQWGTRLAARAWEMCWVVPVTGCDLREV
ncbi:MAG TPA: hypothetical protein PLN42_00405 [Anaerolineae bacterium]|nr:hypothetical protein [Anaerolineae bacterium]